MAQKNQDGDFRAQARSIAEKHEKADKRQATLLKAGIAAIIVAILAIIGMAIWQVQSSKISATGPVPASSNQHGGVVIAQDGVVKGASDVQEVDVDALPEPPEDAPETPDPEGVVEPGAAAESGDPVQIVVWQDFDCVHCHEFEDQYADQVQELVDSGKATVEYRSLNFLDNATHYSSRAAAAFYEVADQVSADDALAFQKELFTHQGEGGLEDKEIVEIASKHGADISEAMKDQKWRTMVDYTTKQAQIDGIKGTPTVMIDGKEWTQEKSVKETVKAAAKKK